MKRKLNILKCPRCGKEYLPSEIFIPQSFFGNPGKIIRDLDGKIVDFEGTYMDLNESYTCDKCDYTFRINSKISFEVLKDESLNFDEDYQSIIS